MGSLTRDQWIGILLLIAAVLIFVPIPIIGGGGSIGAVIIVAIAIYHFIR